MKNKKVTYLLIVLVILVWGLILYRMIGALAGEGEGDTRPAEKVKKEAFNDYDTPKDTAKLAENYRDPFGLAKPEDTLIRTRKTALKLPGAVKAAVVTMNWDFVRYVGYIRNPRSKSLIAMIHVNGQELMLGEGESSGQIRLLKNLRDSIKVSYNGKTKFIVIRK